MVRISSAMCSEGSVWMAPTALYCQACNDQTPCAGGMAVGVSLETTHEHCLSRRREPKIASAVPAATEGSASRSTTSAAGLGRQTGSCRRS